MELQRDLQMNRHARVSSPVWCLSACRIANA